MGMVEDLADALATDIEDNCKVKKGYDVYVAVRDQMQKLAEAMYNEGHTKGSLESLQFAIGEMRKKHDDEDGCDEK